MEILLKCSIGEVYDKLTILEIKKLKIKDPSKLKNVSYELNYILNLLDSVEINEEVINYIKDLKDINNKLWEIEDAIRIKEEKKIFDQHFIDLARSVYITNDKRSLIKKKINISLNSDLIEEKSYKYM